MRIKKHHKTDIKNFKHMKNPLNYLIIILSMSMLSCAVKAQKAPETLAVFPSITLKTEQSLKKLTDKIYDTSDKELIKTFKALKKKQRQLFRVLKRCNRNLQLTPEYLVTLSESQKVLDQLFQNYEKTDNKQFLLESIYKDYAAKRKSINYYVAKDANAKIKVIINSNENEGYFVFAKLSYEKGMDIKRFRFDSPTNNASLSFVPGYYLFWLEKDGRVSEPELHLIVGDATDIEKRLTLKSPK